MPLRYDAQFRQRSLGDVGGQITEVDNRGREIAAELASRLPDVREVRDYSEGKLSYVP